MTASELPPITRWENVTAPKGLVHVIHGLAEHPGRYDRLACALNGAGLIVWAHHQRGHGTNPVPGIRGHFGDEGGWPALVHDARAVSERMQGTWPRLPLVLFAHSMGSFVAQGVLAGHGGRYRAVVFSGTNGPPGVKEGVTRQLSWLQVVALGKRAPGKWLQKLVFEDTYNAQFGRGAPPNTWLSRDPCEVDKYNHDEMSGFPLTSQAWRDLLTGRDAQCGVAFFRRFPAALPIHVIAGTCDPVGENGKGVRRLLDALADAGLSSVSSRFYDGARHELVNETNRDEVTRDLIEWISARVQT